MQADRYAARQIDRQGVRQTVMQAGTQVFRQAKN